MKEPHWDDIAAALECVRHSETIPAGVRQMIAQAISELRDCRALRDYYAEKMQHYADQVAKINAPPRSEPLLPSRRDYFAAAALSGLCSQSGWPDVGSIAEYSAKAADSTIAELDKKP